MGYYIDCKLNVVFKMAMMLKNYNFNYILVVDKYCGMFL